jgi:hypothetical protein
MPAWSLVAKEVSGDVFALVPGLQILSHLAVVFGSLEGGLRLSRSQASLPVVCPAVFGGLLL